MVLLASSARDPQQALGWFAVECEAIGMRVSTSKSETMIPCRKMVDCLLQLGGELRPQEKEFKCLGFLFMSDGKMEQKMDKRFGAASSVLRVLLQTNMVKES